MVVMVMLRSKWRSAHKTPQQETVPGELLFQVFLAGVDLLHKLQKYRHWTVLASVIELSSERREVAGMVIVELMHRHLSANAVVVTSRRAIIKTGHSITMYVRWGSGMYWPKKPLLVSIIDSRAPMMATQYVFDLSRWMMRFMLELPRQNRLQRLRCGQQFQFFLKPF